MVESGDETFLESCCYNGACESPCIADCNCLLFEQYAYLRDWLSCVGGLNKNIQDVEDEAPCTNFKAYLAKVCEPVFKYCDGVKQTKADIGCAVVQGTTTIATQNERLVSELGLEAQQAQGLICLLYVCVDILSRFHEAQTQDKLFDILRRMFFDAKSASNLSKCVQRICKQAPHFDVLACIPEIKAAGVKDGLDEQNVSIVLDCISKIIMYLQKTDKKLPMNRGWFVALGSLGTT